MVIQFKILIFLFLCSFTLVAQTGWYPHLTTNYIWSTIYFRDSLNGWLGGSNQFEQGFINRTTDGGTTWSSQSLPSTSQILRITFPEALFGFAVSRDGKIFKTIDGGSSWHQRSAAGVELHSIQYIGNGKGWACGGNIIFSTTDYGETWEKHSVAAASQILDIYFKNENEGMAIGESNDFYKSTDGGEQWTKIDPLPLFGFDICFTSETRGVIVGNRIVLTTDGGNSWNVVYDNNGEPLYSASFADSLVGWAVGNNIILKTSDGGSTWNKQLIPELLPFVSVHAIDRLHAWVAGWMLLYKTTNGGDPYPIPIPKLVSPLNGAVDLLSNFKLEWDPVPYAAKYYVQISAQNDFKNIIYQDSTTFLYSFPPSQNLNSEFYWRVSVSTYAGKSDWSMAWKFNTLSLSTENIEFPLSIGTKWYYRHYSYKQNGFITREIIDTTTTGFRIVSVKSVYSNRYNNSTSTEYWYYHKGNFYINSSPSIDTVYFYPPPLFISSLKKDSTYAYGSLYYSWHLNRRNYFGNNYYVQTMSHYQGGMSGSTRKSYIFATGIGLTFIQNESNGSIIDSTYIVGFFRDQVFIGDSVNPIKSDTNWLKTSLLSNLTVNSIATKGEKIFAGTNNGIYVSTNNGISWNTANTGLSDNYITALLFVGDTLFVGTGNEIARSTDEGAHWITVNTGIPYYNGYGVSTLTSNGRYLFAGKRPYGIYRSLDYGNNWVHVSAYFTNVQCLTSCDSVVYVGTSNVLARSPDDGIIWTQVIGVPSSEVASLASNNKEIYAGVSGGIYRSTDNGIIWTQVNSGLKYTWSAPDVTVNGSLVFARTGDGRVFYSKNKGDQWELINTDWTDNTFHTMGVNNSYLFIGTYNGGLWRYSLADINTEVKSQKCSLPETFELHQNYPNPFNPSTTISFSIPVMSEVKLVVYDCLGRKVAALVNEHKNIGRYSVNFNAGNLASGIYLYVLYSEKYTIVKKMLLLR
jgi:photosystem II stability/assembly factor-like uncharacterized protein